MFTIVSIANASPNTADKKTILDTFIEYESLNNDFIYSLKHKKGKSGKSYTELRAEVEKYAEGPYQNTLVKSKKYVCKSKSKEIVIALIRVIITSLNSASESPSYTLGEMYLCQPDTVINAYTSLTKVEKNNIFPLLSFGFENVVYNKPQNNKKIVMLRNKLIGIKPK